MPTTTRAKAPAGQGKTRLSVNEVYQLQERIRKLEAENKALRGRLPMKQQVADQIAMLLGHENNVHLVYGPVEHFGPNGGSSQQIELVVEDHNADLKGVIVNVYSSRSTQWVLNRLTEEAGA